MSDTFDIQVLEDSDGQLYLPFSDQLLNQVGWDVGDKLIWEEVGPISWSIKKEDSDENWALGMKKLEGYK